MLTSLKITKWSTSAINFPTDRHLASRVGRILVDPYSPARPAKVPDTHGGLGPKSMPAAILSEPVSP